MIVKLLHIIILRARMAVVHVSVPPSWRMIGYGDCSFFYVLRHQVSDSAWHSRPFAGNVLARIGEEAVLQDKL